MVPRETCSPSPGLRSAQSDLSPLGRGVGSTISAPPICRVAPGGDEQRHMEMAFRLAHGKAQRDVVEERWIGHRHAAGREVLADGKSQLIAADRHWPAA